MLKNLLAAARGVPLHHVKSHLLEEVATVMPFVMASMTAVLMSQDHSVHVS